MSAPNLKLPRSSYTPLVLLCLACAAAGAMLSGAGVSIAKNARIDADERSLSESRARVAALERIMRESAEGGSSGFLVGRTKARPSAPAAPDASTSSNSFALVLENDPAPTEAQQLQQHLPAPEVPAPQPLPSPLLARSQHAAGVAAGRPTPIQRAPAPPAAAEAAATVTSGVRPSAALAAGAPAASEWRMPPGVVDRQALAAAEAATRAPAKAAETQTITPPAARATLRPTPSGIPSAATAAAAAPTSPASSNAPSVPLKIEAVAGARAGVAKVDASGVTMISGKRVRVGETFESGEKLISVDPSNATITTDQRRLVIL